MAKYHINPKTGQSGVCSATVKCRFGDTTHYDSKVEAQRAYEASMASTPMPTHRIVTKEQRERVRGDARAIAAHFLDKPEWLPPVDDPAAPDGVDEEEGWIKSMDAFRDPLVSMGNCGVVAEAVQRFTEGELPYVEVEVGGPYLNIHAANLYRDRDGSEWVFDYTYSQIDPRADWPHVAPRDEWEANVKAAGWTPADEIKAAYEASEDTSYKMSHQPDRDGAQAHDIESYYPNFYTHPKRYLSEGKAGEESIRVLQSIRDKPDAEVTIYRALPDARYGIRPGNWVTLSRSYAEQHAESSEEPSKAWSVIEIRVKARDIRTPGDSINEWGYYPED